MDVLASLSELKVIGSKSRDELFNSSLSNH